MHEGAKVAGRGEATLAHVTVVTRRGGYRINDRIGERRQLCGAEPALGDILYRDAKRMDADTLSAWVTCPRCRDLLRGAA